MEIQASEQSSLEELGKHQLSKDHTSAFVDRDIPEDRRPILNDPTHRSITAFRQRQSLSLIFKHSNTSRKCEYRTELHEMLNWSFINLEHSRFKGKIGSVLHLD